MRHRSERDIDEAWLATALDTLQRWDHLSPADRDQLVEQAKALDRTRLWEGLDGLTVTPEMRARVAAQACLLTLNIGLGVLSDVTSILIAPTSIVRTARHRLGGSIVSESRACVLGESLMHGPIRLAWDRVIGEIEADLAESVVLHEFAHKIDMADGEAGGTPPIGDRGQATEFEHVTGSVLDVIRESPSRALGPYAATNRAELFAVATEAFFLRSRELRAEHPGLHRVLAGYYRQDPTHSGTMD